MPAEKSWHKLNDNLANTVVLDYSGNGLDGVASQNTNLFTAPPLASSHDASFYFDSTNERVLVAPDPLINNIFDSGGSISFWLKMVNPESISSKTYCQILGKAKETSVDGWLLYWWSDNKVSLYQDFSGGSGNSWKINNALSRNTVYHFVITYDNSDTNNDPIFYINGSSVALTQTTNVGGSRDTDILEYMHFNAKGDRTGLQYLEDIRLYDEILTQDNVDSLYNLGDGIDVALDSLGGSSGGAILTTNKGFL